MFQEMLGESIAKAVFWVIIIGVITLCIRFIVKDILDYLLLDIGGKKEDE